MWLHQTKRANLFTISTKSMTMTEASRSQWAAAQLLRCDLQFGSLGLLIDDLPKLNVSPKPTLKSCVSW